MNQPDPLAHADVLAAYGRTKEAAEILREAIRRNPSRPDLRIRLEEFTTKHTLPWRDRIRIGIHLAMVWVILLGSIAFVFSLPVSLIKSFETQFESLAARWGMIWFLAFLLIAGIVLIIAWIYLFLVLWFSNLKFLGPEVRRKVEVRLPWVVNVFAFEPIYSKVRRHFFYDNGA